VTPMPAPKYINKRPSSVGRAAGAKKAGRAEKSKNRSNDNASLSPRKAPYTDRHGHHLSPHVLQNWSPAMLRVLGVRPVDGDEQ
jgi:hypothetical protein